MFLLFFMLWIIFNGQLTLEIAAFGIVISVLIVLFMCKFMDYSMKKELMFVRLWPWMIQYGFILLWEIVKANVDTAKFILNQKIEVEPQLIHFTSPLKTELGKVILANSITLTPGTITVSLENNEYTVHCLDRDYAGGMDDSVFVHQLLKMERIMEEAKGND